MRRGRVVVEMVGVLLLALALPGCGALVVGEGDSGEGASSGGDQPTAVAMRFSQWPPPVSSSSLFNLSVVISATPAPDSLVLFFASKAQACPQPFLSVAELGMDPATCAEQ